MNPDGGGSQQFTSTPLHTSSLSTQLMNSKCKQVKPAYGTKTRIQQVGRSPASTATGVQEGVSFFFRQKFRYRSAYDEDYDTDDSYSDSN
jgi:hypothetical protein